MKRVEVEQSTIFIGLADSRAYGLNKSESDYDYRGVSVTPKKYYLGFESIKQKNVVGMKLE